MDQFAEPTRKQDDGCTNSRYKRKPYGTPQLIEYGSIEKLTQSAGNTTLDHGAAKKVGV